MDNVFWLGVRWGWGVGVVIGSCSYIFLFKCALNRCKLSLYDADLIVAFFVIAVRSASMVSLTEILLDGATLSFHKL